jgi:hypothetical protein
MTAPATLDRFRRILANAECGLPPDNDDAAWCFARLVDYVSHAHEPGRSIDAAFGVTSSAGDELWWRTIARERRDQAMRDLASMLCPAGTLADREIAVRAELRRYDRRWQRVDRFAATMPPNYSGRIEALLFRAFEAANRVGESITAQAIPIGRTQLRKILSPCSYERTRIAESPRFSDTAAWSKQHQQTAKLR